MNENEYFEKSRILFEEWERDSRKWLKKNDMESRATFYKDGIVCPQKWFKLDRRILFVLKEVHETPFITENRCIDFIHSDKDIWDGEITWRKIGSFARGILSLDSEGNYDSYYLYEKNDRDMQQYHEILNQISIINIKKYPGGSSTDSICSEKTGCYKEHAAFFLERLSQQIELIDPTIIICCGKGIVKNCIEPVLSAKKNIQILDAYHPTARVSIEKYYDEIIKQIKC